MADRHLEPGTPVTGARKSGFRPFGIGAAVFVSAFLTGSLVSYLIEGVARYRESAIGALIVAGLMAWQMHKNNKSNGNG